MNASEMFRLMKIITKGWTEKDKRYDALTALVEGLEAQPGTPAPVAPPEPPRTPPMPSEPPKTPERVFYYTNRDDWASDSRVRLGDRSKYTAGKSAGTGMFTVVDFTVQGYVVIQFDNQPWPTVVTPESLKMYSTMETPETVDEVW